jgi:hypothetical protein
MPGTRASVHMGCMSTETSARASAPFALKRPCGNCPFRTDRVPFLSRDRAQEIADSLLDGASFHCHKTLDYEPWCGWGRARRRKPRVRPRRVPGRGSAAVACTGAEWAKRSVYKVHTLGFGSGSYRGRIGPDSACFRGCPMIAREGMQFQSHLGQRVFPVQGLVGR